MRCVMGAQSKLVSVIRRYIVALHRQHNVQLSTPYHVNIVLSGLLYKDSILHKAVKGLLFLSHGPAGWHSHIVMCMVLTCMLYQGLGVWVMGWAYCMYCGQRMEFS